MKPLRLSKLTAALLGLAPAVVLAGTLKLGTETLGTYDTLGTVVTDGNGNVTLTVSGFVPSNSGSTTPPTNPPPTYSIGGTVSGLTASGLVLLNNGTDSLPVSSGATTFTFGTATSGYNVSVGTQPSGLSCTVSNGIGTASAAVTSVAVSCAVISAPTPVPTNVTIMTGISYPLGGVTYPNLGQLEIKAFPYKPNANLTLKQIITSVTSSTASVPTSTWVSTTPGGSPLVGSGQCSASGINTSFGYGTIAGASGCQLQPGVQYYINVQNSMTPNGTTTTCPTSNCGFVLGVSGGGS